MRSHGGRLGRSYSGETDRLGPLTSIVKAMARFFWFTIEFGLMRSAGLRVYGSGLLSSFGEIEHAIESPSVQRFPLQLEWVINQSSRSITISRCCLSSIVRATLWARGTAGAVDEKGRLGNVAPGEPEIKEGDLKSFLNATLK